MKKTRDAVEILDRRIGDDAELRQMIAEESVNARVAGAIYELRTSAGLTQSELAKLVGTTQPVIARLEDADYKGHSLKMLIRVANALNKEVDVRFVNPEDRRPDKASRRRKAVAR